MKTVKIGILGLGTVGGGTYEILQTNKALIEKRIDRTIEVVKVLEKNMERVKALGLEESQATQNPDDILKNPDIDIVVESLGGIEPSTTFMLTAMENGKGVVTPNKAAVAANFDKLHKTAKENGVGFRFEASVGGGIPIIRPLNQSLTADEITHITGILNGTTNYILTKMSKEGLDFDTLLKEALDLGYAERNPSADVDGFDACRKIAILASLAYGYNVDFEEIYTEGITKITDVDFKYANKMGRSIKLFGNANKVEDKFYAYVAPVMIGSEHPLFSVNGVFNGILVNGNVLGDVMFYGSGAGKLPTASAVVSDIVDAVKHLNTNIMSFWSSKKLELTDIRLSAKKFFVRVSGSVEDKLQAVEAAFGKVEVVLAEGVENEFGFVTEVITEEKYEEASKKVEGVITRIRMED